MKHIIVSILLILWIMPDVMAQKLVPVYARYYNGDTAWAHKKFKKFIKKKREPYAAQYGLALCISPWQKKQAFIEFKKLDAKFRHSGKDFTRYMLNNYGITRDSVKFRMDEIASQELRRIIEEDSTERGFKKYIDAYKGCSPEFINRAVALQEAAAYRAAMKDTTLGKAWSFIKNYPNSKKRGYVEDYIDSVHYFSMLMYKNEYSLKQFLRVYAKGSKYTSRAENLLSAKFHDELYDSPYNKFVFTPEYFEKWRREAYYSGHWTRLRFFYKRVPEMMNDSLKRMYYAALYGEANFETIHFNFGDDRHYQDSIYDFYIQRGAPSYLAFKKMQEMYSMNLYRGEFDSVETILKRYEHLFPNFQQQILQIRRIMYEEYYRCKRQPLTVFGTDCKLLKSTGVYTNRKHKVITKYFNTPRQYPEYPVISPDGNTLYYTMPQYKMMKLETKISAKDWDSSSVITSPIYIGTNICASKLDGTRIMSPVVFKEINGSDSVYIKRVKYNAKLQLNHDTAKYECQFIEDSLKYFHKEQKIVKPSEAIFTNSISNDGTRILLAKCHRALEGKGAPPIYHEGFAVFASLNRGGKWSKPAFILGVNQRPPTAEEIEDGLGPQPHFGNYNGHYSPDGSRIFYTSARPDVIAYDEKFTLPPFRYSYTKFFGKKWEFGYKNPKWFYSDIYMSVKQPDGKWSLPINVGRDINTEYCELAPVIAADNKTMYFISEAHYGMGGTDIFMTQRTDSTWRHWTAPINLGKYINTPFNEFDFSITADGRTAVYTSEDPVTQERIIYRVTLPPALRPDTVAIYSGEITDFEGNPLSAQITVDDTKRTRRYATYNNQPDGSYYFGLPQDSAYYRITVSVKGLLPQTDYLDAMWGKPITRTHNFVMFSEADIFESCLAVPLTAIEFKSSDPNLYGAPDEEIKRMSSLFKKHNCDTLQLIVSAPQRYIAQQRADAIAYLFQQNGIKTVLVAIKVGKDGVMIKRM